MNVKITPQETNKQNELQKNLLKTFKFTSYVMGYHVYKDRCTPVKSEVLKWLSSQITKRTNLLLQSWRMIVWSDIYKKKKLENLQKFFFTFNKPMKSHQSRKWKGMKVLCKLCFSAKDSFIQILKQQLPTKTL